MPSTKPIAPDAESLPNLKSTLNKTPNFKQQKKRREEMQKKRNEEKQRQQVARKASNLPPEKA